MNRIPDGVGWTALLGAYSRHLRRPVHYAFALDSSPRVWLFDGTFG